MSKLKELNHLNVKGLDNLTGLPRCIQQNPQKIIKYLKSKALSTKGYYRMKLMLVGKSNRGKTTLVARLQGKGCRDKSTVGVDVSEWKYRPSSGKKNFYFSIWDFGGQEEYYATHQCFLSERAIYLVLFNLKQGDEGVHELTPWLNNIALRAPKSVVLIVGTHLDEIQTTERTEKADRVLEKAADIASKFVNKLQIVQVLAVGLDDTLEGVAGLKECIYRCAAEYKLSNGEFAMGQNIPASYYKLDKHILWVQKQMRHQNHNPIMHREEYKALVQELNLTDITEDDDLKMATLFLSDVGTLLHYDDYGHHLDELYFVDPKWLCDMMAKFVTVRERNPFVRDGVLFIKDIPLLFRDERFPWQYCKQYLALLDQFEVALALDKSKILIPSLLPELRPEGVDVNEKNGVPLYTRLFIFNRSTTPSGFWSRLISRIMHAIPKIFNTVKMPSEMNATSFNAECLNNLDENILRSDSTQQSLGCTPLIHSFSLSVTANVDGLQAKLLYWRTGIFYEDAHVIFRVQSLSETHHKKEGVEIMASPCPLGRTVVGQLLDFIGALVKDWYPGLEGGGPLEQTVLCCECVKLKRTDPYQFNVQMCRTLIGQCLNSVDCGYSKDPLTKNHSVPLADIVPDLLLQDINMKFLLNVSELEYNEDADSVLGSGGFGAVYRGKHKDKSVAIKKYLYGDEALGELRNEAMLLQRSHHPCLVCLVGVCMHPVLALVLEEAPLGCLETIRIKKKLPMHRVVIHRIAVQVAAALKFLHDGGIIFRDLKAANVLMWSLDPESLCHCKITDFGIATNATPVGARGLIGTKGFIAPEVLHIGKKREHSLYDHMADIFSFGMLLYQMLSCRHPFHDILPVRIDTAVEQGERPTLHDIPESENAYVYLAQLMQLCWQSDPRKRPSTHEIIEKLSLSSFQSAMTVRPVPSSFSLRNACIVSTEDFSRVGCSDRENELWVCCDGDVGMEISIYSTNTMAALSKYVINGNQVQCINLCGEHMWFASRAGIGDGSIDIFSIISREPVKKIQLNDQSVTCITFLNETVYCGTLDGFCLTFDQELNKIQCNSRICSKHISDIPVDGILATKDCVWLSYANVIAFMNLDTLEVVGTIKRGKCSGELIGQLQMNSDKTIIWSAYIKGGNCLSAWDAVLRTHIFDINIKECMNSIHPYPVKESSITAFVPALDNVWVGLDSGQILIFCHQELLMWFHPYKWYVRFLFCIPCEGPCHTEKSMVVSGGKGFQSCVISGLPDYEDPEMSRSGTLVVWEAFPSKINRQMSMLQPQSSTYLKDHESARGMIQWGGFADGTFLIENSDSAAVAAAAAAAAAQNDTPEKNVNQESVATYG